MVRVPSDDEFHPELAEYVPHDRPLRHPMTVRIMRIVVVVGVFALVIPGMLVTLQTQARSAAFTCSAIVAASAPGYDGTVRFELGDDGPGWYCYSVGFDRQERLFASLGLIPEARTR
ncbi:hypothetical protein [Schumannella sp. 10F1B-5-1]|uniref:hypothetical protein n=1 Tax=Schumannella sp. 10F1B-5-1 TaxID=2590780 RepID=UPI001131A323|nr:hypothetical protein [Schumannella sp. 10F1B-5-1]TPW73022.1 hypothetical protein FJ658_07170 [Schumannella sp. 10F1B-5-1]